MKHNEELFKEFASQIVDCVDTSEIDRRSVEEFAQAICKACRDYAEIVNAESIERLKKIAMIVDEAPKLDMGSDDEVVAVIDALDQIHQVLQ